MAWHPVFCRVLPSQRGGGEHLLLHAGRVEEEEATRAAALANRQQPAIRVIRP